MKSIRIHQFGGPDVLKLEELPDPKPAAGAVLVRVHAAGVNPVDTYVRAGQYAVKPDLPYTPGMEAAGVIASVGEGVVDLKEGDRVWISATNQGQLQGACAELAVCPAAHVHPLPDRLSFEQGAAINIAYVTAWRAALEFGKLAAGEVVLIHGASGGVGNAAVQIAAAAGAIVFGTASTPDGRQAASDSGATRMFDHSKNGYLDEIKNATDGKGANLIIEMLANVNLSHDLDLLAPGGRVVVIGSRGPVEIDPRKMMGGGLSITGMTYFHGGEGPVLHAIAAVNAGLAAGSLTPTVGETFPLAEAAKAHIAVMESGAKGKVVLRCTG